LVAGARFELATFGLRAVCFHKGKFHMVFVANNSSRELLHAFSSDGIGWQRLHDVRQSTKEAPALASFNGILRVVFVANNDTNSLLQCTYIDNDDVWSQNNFLGESSKSAPTLHQTDRVLMYFVANNDTNDLLVTQL